MQKILLDCDGVLLNWNHGFIQWMNRQGYKELETEWYSISKRYGIEKELAFQLVNHFNESADIGFLSVYKNADLALNELAVMGYKFDIITALSIQYSSQALRCFNLGKEFPHIEFENIHFVDTGSDKLDLLKEKYNNTGLFFIEDKIANAEDGLRAGLRSLLIRNDHHTNETIPSNIPIFDTWRDIVDHIIEKDV